MNHYSETFGSNEPLEKIPYFNKSSYIIQLNIRKNMFPMVDGIDFYLYVLKRISEFYNSEENELCISEKIAELMKELKENNNEQLVKRAISFVLEIFEKYHYDEYNTTNLSSGAQLQTVSSQDRDIFTQALAQELFQDDYPTSEMINLNKIPSKDKEILMKILRKELNS